METLNRHLIKVGLTRVGRAEVQNSSSESVINGPICNFMPPCGAERTFHSHLGHPPRKDLASPIGLFVRFQIGRFLQTFFHSCEQNGIAAVSPKKKNTPPPSTEGKVSSQVREIRFTFKQKRSNLCK